MTRIAVIGGGLAGLTAALRLSARGPIELFEASARLGGQLHTEWTDGFVIERGGEGFVARSEAVPTLVRDVGLPEDDLIGQAVQQSYGFEGEALRLLAPGEAATLLGFQVPQEELGKGIRSLRRGMGSLTAALAERARDRVSIALERPVAALTPRDGGIALQTRDGAVYPFEAVVIATSSAAAAPLLQPLVGPAAEALAAAPTLSSVTVELAFARAQIAHPLDGTGFVVALDAQREGLRACTFTTSKFVERAPPGMVSLRVFLRPEPEELRSLSEDDWTARALAGLQRVLPVSGAPHRSWVSRWPSALPVFTEAHRSAVAKVEEALAPWPVLLAGSAFHGSGIDAAIRSAERAAARLLASI